MIIIVNSDSQFICEDQSIDQNDIDFCFSQELRSEKIKQNCTSDNSDFSLLSQNTSTIIGKSHLYIYQL